jgi:hypothetical protein
VLDVESIQIMVPAATPTVIPFAFVNMNKVFSPFGAFVNMRGLCSSAPFLDPIYTNFLGVEIQEKNLFPCGV